MGYLTIDSFKELIDTHQYVNEFDSLHLNFEFIISEYNVIHIYKLKFKNCKFENVHIHNLKRKDLDLKFIDCVFNGETKITNNEINDLTLVWFNPLEEHQIKCSKFNISDNKFSGRCKINKLIFTIGDFYFVANIFLKVPVEIIPKRETEHTVCEIKNCNINNFSFNNNTFYMPLNFLENKLMYNDKYSGHSFDNNIFHKTDFTETDFGQQASFKNCDFLGTTIFNSILNLRNTKLHFQSCKFLGFTHFGSAEISEFSIEYTSFKRPVSFKEANFNLFRLFEVKFESGAFFDDLKINNIGNNIYYKELDINSIREWKHTLRQIKQELSKSDNKIDYNRFRVFEFDSYKFELKQEIKNFKSQIPFFERLFKANRQYAKAKRDIFILRLSESVSDYGTDWKRALKFTLLFGFLLYIPFFVFENCKQDWDFSNWQVFPIGFLRFFILTDFYSPLKDGRTYIDMDGWNHLVSWFLFIFGKIVIAFGIYEMTQAFRKFKA